MIVVAGQGPGADRDPLIGRIGCAVQVVNRKPQGVLSINVTSDCYIAA